MDLWRTEVDFGETLSLLDEVKYDGVFSFKYSPRLNTAASSMPDAIREEGEEQASGIAAGKATTDSGRNTAVVYGETFEVHVDGKSKKENSWYGHSSCNRVVSLNSIKADLLGQYVQARVTGCTPNSLLGEHIL